MVSTRLFVPFVLAALALLAVGAPTASAASLSVLPDVGLTVGVGGVQAEVALEEGRPEAAISTAPRDAPPQASPSTAAADEPAPPASPDAQADGMRSKVLLGGGLALLALAACVWLVRAARRARAAR